MTVSSEMLGALVVKDNHIEVTFVRELEHGQRSIWAMLTDSSKFIDWLAPGSIELRKGGRARLNFIDSGIVIDSIVSQFDPPRLLEYSWSGPGDPIIPIRWEIESMDRGARVILKLQSRNNEDVAKLCAGWEAHFMMLVAAIESKPILFPFEHFMSVQKDYRKNISALL